MNTSIPSKIRRLGGDPEDEVWQWFLKNGPHGPSFTWGQTRANPPGYVGVEHLQRIVAEMAEADPSFPARARSVVQKALGSEQVGALRRAIQVAAVVGGEGELQTVDGLKEHENDSVAADARASAFYLKRRLRAERA